MSDKKTWIWKYCIASLSLIAVVAVYCLARIYPPVVLTPLQATHSILAAQTWIFGSAPSFFYTLSIGLLVGASSSTLTGVRMHLWFLRLFPCYRSIGSGSRYPDNFDSLVILSLIVGTVLQKLSRSPILSHIYYMLKCAWDKR